MSWRSVPFRAGAGLTAAFLLLTSPVLAGDRVRSSSQSTSSSRFAPAPVAVYRPASQSVSISVVVTPPADAAKDPLSVRLRGPDGQVRQFPVEGGRAAIQYVRPVVLRAGQSVTIRWVAAK